MKTLSLVFIYLCIATLCQAQIDGRYIYPSSTPTESDSIVYIIRVPLASGSWKMSGVLTQPNDTMYYKGCYFKSITSTDYYVYDTVVLGRLSVGIYHLVTRVIVSPDNFDTLCELPPQALQTRNYDTIITVSKYSGISYAGRNQLQAVMLNADMVQLYAPHTGTVSVQVYDALGRLHYSNQSQVVEGKNEIRLDLPDLPSGLYLYHIQLGEQRKVLKFVKR